MGAILPAQIQMVDWSVYEFNGAWRDAPVVFFNFKFTKRNFQENCCHPWLACSQIWQKERYEGGRGYNNGQPICETWNSVSTTRTYIDGTTNDNLGDPNWIIDNCCA